MIDIWFFIISAVSIILFSFLFHGIKCISYYKKLERDEPGSLRGLGFYNIAYDFLAGFLSGTGSLYIILSIICLIYTLVIYFNGESPIIDYIVPAIGAVAMFALGIASVLAGFWCAWQTYGNVGTY